MEEKNFHEMKLSRILAGEIFAIFQFKVFCRKKFQEDCQKVAKSQKIQ